MTVQNVGHLCLGAQRIEWLLLRSHHSSIAAILSFLEGARTVGPSKANLLGSPIGDIDSISVIVRENIPVGGSPDERCGTTLSSEVYVARMLQFIKKFAMTGSRGNFYQSYEGLIAAIFSMPTKWGCIDACF